MWILTGKSSEKDRKIHRENGQPSITVGKVLAICSRIYASPNALNKVISLDPVLTGQVLELIKSAYSSLMSKGFLLLEPSSMSGQNVVSV